MDHSAPREYVRRDVGKASGAPDAGLVAALAAGGKAVPQP